MLSLPASSPLPPLLDGLHCRPAPRTAACWPRLLRGSTCRRATAARQICRCGCGASVAVGAGLLRALRVCVCGGTLAKPSSPSPCPPSSPPVPASFADCPPPPCATHPAQDVLRVFLSLASADERDAGKMFRPLVAAVRGVGMHEVLDVRGIGMQVYNMDQGRKGSCTHAPACSSPCCMSHGCPPTAFPPASSGQRPAARHCPRRSGAADARGAGGGRSGSRRRCAG